MENHYLRVAALDDIALLRGFKPGPGMRAGSKWQRGYSR